MKTFTISEREVFSLRDVQVSFVVNFDGLVSLVQIDIRCKFTGFYVKADFEAFSQTGKTALEEVCARWYNSQFAPTPAA